jgi:uncharacterized protein
MAETRKPIKLPETEDGAVIYNVPFPRDLTALKGMAPIITKSHYEIDYIHSYGQDSPFFAGLANGKLLGTRCSRCPYTYGTPRLHCMYCGGECDWFELPAEGFVHTFTVCHYGSQEFLPETPFVLILVEWPGVDTLFLSRLVGVDPAAPALNWVGMKIRAQFKRLSKLKPTDVYFVPA